MPLLLQYFRLLFDLAAKYSFGDKKRYKFFINDELSLTPHLQRLDRMHNVGRDYKITSLSCLQSK
ncbi:MAG: hypothetical protein QMD21_05620, partial [Candidatus Thermoplasmatota archaeon]|nr:hypothetical protein [Candidatus Thermoplasmatota archaeon]